MLNRVILIGRLVRDPDCSYTTNGIPLAKFTLAVDRPVRTDESGQRETDFIDCVAWRQRADFIERYVKKGRLVAVEGRLQIRQWEAADGSRRRAAEIQVDQVQALDRPRDAVTETDAPPEHDDNDAPPTPARAAAPQAAPAAKPLDAAADTGEVDPFAE